MPGARILKIVVIKLIAPKIEDAPARCRAKIARSIAGPESHRSKGAHRSSSRRRRLGHRIALHEHRKDKEQKEKGNSQNEILFMRGNAMSGAPIIKGVSQLPKPPIIAGMSLKNTMISP
jgi:hypothetical protein